MGYIFNLDVDTLDDLVEAIASQKYFAGVMTSDVAAYHQEKLFEKDLRIVRRYESKVPIQELTKTPDILSSSNNLTEELQQCYGKSGTLEYIKGESFQKYRTYIKVRCSLLI